MPSPMVLRLLSLEFAVRELTAGSPRTPTEREPARGKFRRPCGATWPSLYRLTGLRSSGRLSNPNLAASVADLRTVILAFTQFFRAQASAEAAAPNTRHFEPAAKAWLAGTLMSRAPSAFTALTCLR